MLYVVQSLPRSRERRAVGDRGTRRTRHACPCRWPDGSDGPFGRLRNVPDSTEPGVAPGRTVPMELRRGACYVIEDATPEVSYRLFRHLLPDFGSGFCISRLHPEKVRGRLGPVKVRLGWLAEAPGDDHFSANAMASLAKAIQQFVHEHGSLGLVLIDGLEYVIVHNGFQPTLLALVEHLNEFVMGTQAIILIAFRPQTLDARELALLERNVQVLKGDEVRNHLDIEELGEILGQAAEPRPARAADSEKPQVLRPGRVLGRVRVGTVRCAKCGTENSDDLSFCVYCGSRLMIPLDEPPLPAVAAPVYSRAMKPIPRTVREEYERRPDFVGLIGVAFFLMIVGIVFTLNTNLLNDLLTWWDFIVAGGLPGGLFVRPPEGIVESGIAFFGLLGLSNLLTAGLRWVLDRSRFGALARFFAGFSFLILALLTWRYSIRDLTGVQVMSIWTAALGTLLVIYIATGMYWVRTRRPLPTRSQAPTSRP